MQNPQLFSSHKKGVAPAIVFAGAAGPFIFYLLSAVTVTISVSVAAAVAVSVAAAAAVPVITSSAAAVRCPCCAAAAACIPGSIRIPVKIASASAAASSVPSGKIAVSAFYINGSVKPIPVCHKKISLYLFIGIKRNYLFKK